MRNAPGLEWWPPEHRVDSSALCPECRAIDFRAAVCHPQPRGKHSDPYFQIYERDAGSYHQTVKDSSGIDWPVNDPNCRFCRYLLFARLCLPGNARSGRYAIILHHPGVQKSSSSRCEQGFLGSVSDFCITVRYAGGSWKFDPVSLYASIQIICHIDKPTRRECSPQVVSPVFNVSLAKAWLDACNRNHPECTTENDVQMSKTRLIDCVTRKLVSVGDNSIQNPRFVALSYVWGPKMGRTTFAEYLPSKLPLTIRDAMTVTKDLGLQYLWVDQYCIDQSDHGDKDRQIRHMDLIYKCADITIIAAAGYDCDYGLPGVSDRSRDVLDPFLLDGNLTFGVCPYNIAHKKQHWETGSWHTRGWTFQEAHLSRRRLVFSDTAMHFECMRHGECQTEMFGGVECADIDAVEKHYSVDSRSESPDSNNYWYDIEPVVGNLTLSRPAKLDENLPQPVPHQNLEASILSYTELVAQYTRRKLSHTSDGLNAFRGAANALAQFDPPVYNIAGVPFVVHGHGEDSLADTTFSYGLAWWASEGGVVTDSNFPSWSWGNARVWNVLWNDEQDSDYLQRLAADAIDHPRGFQIELNYSGNEKLIGLVEFAEACRNSTPLSRWDPRALCFKARFLSPHVATRLSMEDQAGYRRAFWGYGDRGLGRGLHRPVNLVVNITGTPSDEQSHKNGDAGQGGDYQPHCVVEIDDERLYGNILSRRWSLMLLRCNSREAQLLVVEWQDEPCEPQRTARRVGILWFSTEQRRRHKPVADFLSCFSIERDMRLI